MVDFYKFVPKGLEDNLRYRLELRRRAQHDVQFRRALLTACRHDVLFFFNAFCYLFEPRPRVVNGRKLSYTIPFITWDHQDPFIRTAREHLGFKDIGVEKSRGEGASWIAVLLALHDWLFDPECMVGMVSSTEKKADNPENPDSLFWKIDWELTKLPRWMAGVKGKDYVRNLGDHTLLNKRIESRIVAFSAVKGVARGGRYKWFLMDELAEWDRPKDSKAMKSTQQSTESRLVVSTPQGSEGAYYDVMHNPSSMIRVILDWKQNPVRNRGLYVLEDGQMTVVDPENPLPPHYQSHSRSLISRLVRKGFKVEGVQRSPWYDKQCDRPDSDPRGIAQELDRDYGGSVYRVFGAEFFARVEKSIRPPFLRGNLTYHPESLRPDFDQTDNGPMKLWLSLDVRGQPPPHSYVVAADISTGVAGPYTSNSALTVIDRVTMEQVFEYADNTTSPSDFADLAIATAKWFYNAYLIWEHNGPGTSFTNQVLNRKYENIYWRTSQWRRSRKKEKNAGWNTSPQSKEAMFGAFLRAVKSGELTIRSKAMADECGQYVRMKGKIVHAGAVRSDDDATVGEAHGDRVISICLGWQGVQDRPLAKDPEEHLRQNPPPGTMAARQLEWERAQGRQADKWDRRTNWDMCGGLR